MCVCEVKNLVKIQIVVLTRFSRLRRDGGGMGSGIVGTDIRSSDVVIPCQRCQLIDHNRFVLVGRMYQM